MTTGSNLINRETIDSLTKNLLKTPNKRTFEDFTESKVVTTAQAILNENSSEHSISEKQAQPVKEFSYLISCQYNFLSNAQKLELPRIILERLSNRKKGLSDKEISLFFPENTVVKFTGN
ncbi:MAG TPA: hypothetical protein VLG49_02495, partial [Rhabdochlamydiaceae bacterium]|nr:hypothetical protein [Rhabdochlamydiaceae bacterium]